MRRLDLPSPYGFTNGCPFDDIACRIAQAIAGADIGTWITDKPASLPPWREPMFTAGRPSEGASANAADELPTIARQCAIKPRNMGAGTEGNT